MATKSISATQAKNNFGGVLDDVIRNHTRYVVARRGVPHAVVLSFEDFVSLLDDEQQRQRMAAMLRELRPEYHLGQTLDLAPGAD
jgi:prevent-host-death family protein